jgi:thiamine-monophosphate kinase
MPAGPGTRLGIGDDAAVVAAPDGNVVAAVDMLLEGRHFLRDWSSGVDVGVKAAARSLADIAAMGATPTALLVALAAPPSLPAAWALDLASGLASEAARAGADVVGGDTAQGDSVVISVTALGDLGGRAAVTRSGAHAGDVVAVAGVLGHSAAGLALLSADVPKDELASALIQAHLRPQPPYSAGPAAAELGATAMIDVSDGLLADLGHIAWASGVVIDVDTSALDLGSLPDAARLVPGADPVTWALTGGEDHALVAAFPADAALPATWRIIGRVLPASDPHTREAVLVDGRPWAGPAGWEHFR